MHVRVFSMGGCDTYVRGAHWRRRSIQRRRWICSLNKSICTRVRVTLYVYIYIFIWKWVIHFPLVCAYIYIYMYTCGCTGGHGNDVAMNVHSCRLYTLEWHRLFVNVCRRVRVCTVYVGVRVHCSLVYKVGGSLSLLWVQLSVSIYLYIQVQEIEAFVSFRLRLTSNYHISVHSCKCTHNLSRMYIFLPMETEIRVLRTYTYVSTCRW